MGENLKIWNLYFRMDICDDHLQIRLFEMDSIFCEIGNFFRKHIRQNV